MTLIEQLEAEKELRIKAEGDAKHWNKEHLSLCTKSIFKEEALNEDLKRMQDARNEAEEAGLIWKDSAEKLQAQLKELQPFERGVEGWYEEVDGFHHEKVKYFTYDSKDKVHYCYCAMLGVFSCKDFTTENPHKKEIVFHEDSEHKDIKRRLKKAKLVVCRSFNDIYCVIDVYHGIGYVARYLVTQIGDDLQAKFDDEENLKYIDLGK